MSLDWIDEELQRLAQADLLRRPLSRDGKLAAMIVMDGKRYVNFGSNDYLGLAADPHLASVVERAVSRVGWGSGASPLVVGRSLLHAELERRLATFLECQAALLFPTGFAANTGAIPALVGAGDLIFSDAKNHASIIDGCRLSAARVVVYPHGDANGLESLLRQETSARRRLIVTDGLFSMDGDFAPLPRLVELARQFDAMLMVDEAHALGVVGEEGRGVAEHFGVVADVDVRVGTLSKSFGCHGGFAVGSAQLVEYLANRARSYVFSTAPPAASAAAALAALQIMRQQPERRRRLNRIAQVVREALAGQGWNTGASTSHIIPAIVGSPAAALEMAARLRERGLWVPCIRPPSVPAGQSLLRISLSSAHSDAMIEQLLSVFQDLRPQVSSTPD